MYSFQSSIFKTSSLVLALYFCPSPTTLQLFSCLCPPSVLPPPLSFTAFVVMLHFRSPIYPATIHLGSPFSFFLYPFCIPSVPSDLIFPLLILQSTPSLPILLSPPFPPLRLQFPSYFLYIFPLILSPFGFLTYPILVPFLLLPSSPTLAPTFSGTPAAPEFSMGGGKAPWIDHGCFVCLVISVYHLLFYPASPFFFNSYLSRYKPPIKPRLSYHRYSFSS